MRGASPIGRGSTGTYIEGELGAYYLMAMLAGSEARGMPGAQIEKVRFQGVEAGFSLDDLVIHGTSQRGGELLEIQSKRTISFASKDQLFQAVCTQIQQTKPVEGIDADCHLLAVATQRTSARISGPYQDVLEWAKIAESPAAFFGRLDAPGVANPAMRDFVSTFRTNLVAEGFEGDDHEFWMLLRRFQIIEFDFESSAPQARIYAEALASWLLDPCPAGAPKNLWANLIEIAIAGAKAGAVIDRGSLVKTVSERAISVKGRPAFGLARAKLHELAGFALEDIGTRIGGLQLPRQASVDAIDQALLCTRFIDIRGGPGVGKSAILRFVAQRILRESRAIVLDPVGTPEGGWGMFAQMLNVPGTAREFLTDLAASGGGFLFIDGVDMIQSAARRRTVNDLLREVSKIEGFTIVVTARPDFGDDGADWMAQEAVHAFGPRARIEIGELDEAEVASLRAQAPELDALLAPAHPAAAIARNLYRLSRLLSLPDTIGARTEAELAQAWWRHGDGSEPGNVRAAQRIIADLAEAALAGQTELTLRDDSAGRAHLFASQTLREISFDRIGFYHDVLRDWAVGIRLHDDPARIDRLDRSRPVPAILARGIEMAGRLALEADETGKLWQSLLSRLGAKDAHGSWRRHALLAILRSEAAHYQLDQQSDFLLARGAALFNELVYAISAVDTVATAKIFLDQHPQIAEYGLEVPANLRTMMAPSGPRLLLWCLRNSSRMPLQGLAAFLQLLELHLWPPCLPPAFRTAVAELLFDWLMILDIHGHPGSIPDDPVDEIFDSSARSRLVADLRVTALLLCAGTPEKTVTYFAALAAEGLHHKIGAVLKFSTAVAPVVPKALAKLTASALIKPLNEEDAGLHRRAFSLADNDFMSPSPADAPFIDLLLADRDIGLGLIRRLVAHAVEFKHGETLPEGDGYLIQCADGERFFPWKESYMWARGRGCHYAVASALMALEAWAHNRIEAKEPIANVIGDILGPDGSCAAFVLVAVDVLLSHWPDTRETLVPFLTCPALLASDRTRLILDQLHARETGWRDERKGMVGRQTLQARPSRSLSLERALPHYLSDDPASNGLRAGLIQALALLHPFDEASDFSDPTFMGAHALNVLDPGNWRSVDGGKAYQSPPDEAKQLERMDARRLPLAKSADLGTSIQRALNDPTMASPQLAREAVSRIEGELPSDPDEDELEAHGRLVAATVVLVARDGDEALLAEKEEWVRGKIATYFDERESGHRGHHVQLAYDRSSMAIYAQIHLWLRGGSRDDRQALLNAAGRSDACGPPAFLAAQSHLLAKEPRLLKALLRIACQSCRWRWHPQDEDEAVTQWAKEAMATAIQRAIDSEIHWLDGGEEPDWPALPEEILVARYPSRISIPAGFGGSKPGLPTSRPVSHASERMDSIRLAEWLDLARQACPTHEWLLEPLKAYAAWTAHHNGLGLDRDADAGNHPEVWNRQFYGLLGLRLMSGTDELFQEMLPLVTGLPDRAFCDVAEILIEAADRWYFGQQDPNPENSIRLRQALIARTCQLRRWQRNARRGDFSIDLDTGGLLARLLFNHYTPMSGTRCYLAAEGIDRIDPLFDSLGPLLPGGPTHFVALCLMNLLTIAPQARHAEFAVSAFEIWLQRLQGNVSAWAELGIGRKVTSWILCAAEQDPTLFSQGHPLRACIDAVLGRLVTLGIAEAYEIEQRISQIATEHDSHLS